MNEPYTLTSQQRVVIAYLMQGKSNQEIATAMNRSNANVKFHVSNIFKIVKAKSRTQCILKLVPFFYQKHNYSSGLEVV